MKSLFSKFKREPQQETKVMCNNLSAANDCHLVSEIKSCQAELDKIESELKTLRQFDDNISECYSFFQDEYVRRILHPYYYMDPTSKDELAHALCEALCRVDSNKLIKELTMLRNQAEMIMSKENKANELRNKINEAKNVLGIK